MEIVYYPTIKPKNEENYVNGLFIVGFQPLKLRLAYNYLVAILSRDCRMILEVTSPKRVTSKVEYRLNSCILRQSYHISYLYFADMYSYFAKKDRKFKFWLLLHFHIRSTLLKMKDDVVKGESAEAQT